MRGLPAAEADAALGASLDEGERRAALLLATRGASEIDVLNRVPMQTEISLSPETAEAVRVALEEAERSGGAYDPTVAALREAWGVDRGEPMALRGFEVEGARKRVDWSDLELGESGASAKRWRRRTRIDLGPVAVGAVLDGVADALRTAGAPAGRVEAPGLWVVFGGESQPWEIVAAVDGGDAVRVVLASGAVALARPDPILRLPDGREVHGLIDPRSGLPAVAARFAIARCASGAEAGGAAEALFVLGDEAPGWLAVDSRVAGAIAFRDGRRFASPDLVVDW